MGDLEYKVALQWKQALDFFDKKYFEKARISLEQLLILTPTDDFVPFMMGACHFQLEQYEQAIQSFRKSENMGRKDEDLYANISQCYFNLRRFEEAQKCFEKIINLVINDVHLVHQLAICYQEQKDYNNAVRFFKRAIELDPQEPLRYFNLCNTYSRMKNPEKSIDVCIKALEIIPNDVSLLSLVGRTYLEIDDLTKAEYYISKARELAPNDPETFFSLGELAAYKKKNVEAFTYFIESLNSVKNSEISFIGIENHVYTRIHTLISTYKDLSELLTLLESVFKETEAYSKVKRTLFPLFDSKGEQLIKDTPALRKTIDLLMKDPNVESYEDGFLVSLEQKSNNPVKIFIEDPDSENLYIVKTNDVKKILSEERERILKEYIALLSLNNIFDKLSENKIAQLTGMFPRPFYLYEEYGKIYFFERRINKPSLAELVDLPKKEVMEEIRKSLETLAQIQIFTTKELQKNGQEFFIKAKDEEKEYTLILKRFDYLENLEKRLIKRLGENSATQDFVRECMKVFRQDSLEYFLHGDLNAHNSLSGGFLVDFEKVCIGNPVLDLSYLLESIELNFLSENNKKELISYYIRALNYNDKSNAFWEIVNNNYQKNSVYNLICRVGSNVNQRNMERAQKYLIKATNVMYGKLKDSFISYILNTPYEELKAVLK